MFGEQVASGDGLLWLDVVLADLERCGYAVGASDLCAASVGAPHIRQRIYFVAYAGDLGCKERPPRWLYGSRSPRDVAHRCGEARDRSNPWRRCDWIPCADGVSRPVEPGTFPLAPRRAGDVGRLRAYGNAIVPQVAAAFVEAAIGAIGDVT